MLYGLLDHAELLDHETWPQKPPAEVVRALEEDEDGESCWPLEGDVSETARSYFGFESPDPSRVPLRKLQDAEIWLITPPEATLLAEGIDRIQAGDPTAGAPPWVLAILEDYDIPEDQWDAEIRELLSGFAEFCRAASEQGGFWSH